jgi:hypothetical protein
VKSPPGLDTGWSSTLGAVGPAALAVPAEPGMVAALTHAITPTPAAAAIATAMVRSRSFWTPRSRTPPMWVTDS